jgi:hypothetical protein
MSEAPKIPDRRTTDRGLGGRVLTIEEQLSKGGERMDKHEALLTENTAATQEVLEIVTLAKGFFKVLGHIGTGVKWLTGIATGIVTLWAVWPPGGHK